MRTQIKISGLLGALALGAVLFAGCDSGGGALVGGALSVNFTGNFALAGTNDSGNCLANWNNTGSFSGVQLHLTQTHDSATNVDSVHGTVNGGGGLGLGLAIGTVQFNGSGLGNVINLTAYGTRSNTQDSCVYTVNATANLTLSGDILTGNITYKPNTNGNPTCAALLSCSNSTRINGTRPPQ
jgi:hypothetical protein